MAESRVIEPLKARNLTSMKTNVPELDLGYGLKASKVLLDITGKIDKINQIGKENLVESFLSEYSSKINEFNSKLRYDDSYYKTGDKYNELKKILSKDYETFKETAKDQGFTESEIEKVSNKAREYDLSAETNFGIKYTSYREDQEKQNFLAIQLKKTQNQNTEMFIGMRGEAVKGFVNSVSDIEKAIDNGFIGEAAALKEATVQKRNLIQSNVMSFQNMPGELERLNKLSFEEFQEEYNDLNFKIKNNQMGINSEDYQVFKNAISSTYAEIKRKNKAADLYTKVEFEKDKRERIKNFGKIATENLGMTAYDTYSSRLPEYSVQATNNKYGTDYKSMEEIIDDGNLPQTIQIGFNDKIGIINNPEASSEEVMKARAEEYSEFCEGYNIDIVEPVMNGQYLDEAKIPVGARMTMAYYNQGEAKDLFDKTYTTNNRAVLENYQGIELNIGANTEIYDTEEIRKSEFQKNYIAGASPLQLQKVLATEKPRGSFSDLSLGGKMQGIKLAGVYDKNAFRLSKDIEMFAKDITILMVEESTNGILTEDLAKELKINEKNIGTPISQLTRDQKQKVISTLMATKEFQKEFKRRFEPAFNEITNGIQTVDTGYGHFINISSELDGENIAKAMRLKIEKGEFTTKDGLKPPTNQIIPRTYLNKDKAVFTFNGGLLYINNKPYVMELKGE